MTMSTTTTTTVSATQPTSTFKAWMLDLRGSIKTAADDHDLNIAVHDGVFHADEVSAWAVLALWGHATGAPSMTLIRSRRDEELSKARIILDVTPRSEELLGHTWDHHAHTEWVREDGSPYATAGLVWQALGPQVAWEFGIDETMPEIQAKFVKAVDDSLFKGIDAADCGKAAPTEQPTMSAMISAMNWRDISDATMQNRAFSKAAAWFKQALEGVCQATARRLLAQARAEEVLLPQSGNTVLVLEDAALPWKQVVIDHWEAFGPTQRSVGDELVTLDGSQVITYPDATAPGTWRVQSLPGSLTDPFAGRCHAAPSWRGKRGFEAGGHKWVFTHPAGFIGGVEAADASEAAKAAWVWVNQARAEATD